MSRTSQLVKAMESWILKHPRLVMGIILVACLGPFLNKAVHTDDVLFVLTGQWIQKHPADFFGCQVNWWKSAIPMWMANYNPPLLSYFLAVAGSVFGWSEIVLHLAGLVVAFATAAGIYALAQMWCQRPLLATLAAIFTPAFLVSSTTLMCDVMMLGFWVWSLVLWERALRMERGGWQFVGAGALAGLAILTKYSAVNLLPLLFILGVLRTRKPGRWLLGLIVPLLMLAGYEWITARMYGRGLFSTAVQYAHTTHITFPGGWRASAIIDLAFLGGSLLPFLFFAPWLWRPRALLAGGIPLLGGLILLFELWNNVALNDAAPELMKRQGFLAQAVLLSAGGLLVLLLVAAETWRQRDITTLILVLWIAGTFYFATILNWTINVRSFLPLVPAAAILLVRRLEASRSNLLSGGWLWLPLLPAVAITLSIATADYQLAGAARTAASEITAKYKTANHTLWFEGHAGFQYYMEKLGGQPVDIARSFLEPDDFVVVPEIGIVVGLPPGSVGWIDHVEYTPNFSINLMGGDIKGLAGFYGANLGPLPFLLGRPSYQAYNLVRVFTKAHYVSKPSNPREAQAGEMPDYSRNMCEVENTPIYPIDPELLKQSQAAGRLAADGHIEEAVQRYRELLKQEANNPEALSGLARILATTDRPEWRNGGEAVILATRAVGLTDFRQPQYLQVLAAAYAEAGQFAEAVKATNISYALAFITSQYDLATSNRNLLNVYLARRTVASMKAAGYGNLLPPDNGNPSP